MVDWRLVHGSDIIKHKVNQKHTYTSTVVIVLEPSITPT